jgi:hypothetical protein
MKLFLIVSILLIMTVVGRGTQAAETTEDAQQLELEKNVQVCYK